MRRLGAGAIAGCLFLAAGTAGATELQVPVSPACISSPFGWRHAVGPRAPAGFHNGIDLPAPAGATVRAAAAGRVAAVFRRGPGGMSVLLAHPDGRTTLYAHLGQVAARIASGKRDIAAGEAVGRVGRSGITYGTHLFFAVFDHGTAIDPEAFLSVPRCTVTPARALRGR